MLTNSQLALRKQRKHEKMKVIDKVPEVARGAQAEKNYLFINQQQINLEK